MNQELKELAQLLNKLEVISTNKYGDYLVIQLGDDLDPSYMILDSNLELVDGGSNGFSDGYIFHPSELVNNYLKRCEMK
ncbi:hypothetical protein V6O07_22810 [Arthrospira platensis SPKY2]